MPASSRFAPADGKWFTLDRDYTITEAGCFANETIRSAVGRCVWDVFPEAEKQFRCIYNRAWDAGVYSGTVAYAGSIVRINALREDDELLVDIEFVSLYGLAETIRAVAPQSKEGLFECGHCGAGGGVCALPEPNEELPSCDFCFKPMSLIEVSEPDRHMILEAVERIYTLFGAAGIAELAAVAVAMMSA